MNWRSADLRSTAQSDDELDGLSANAHQLDPVRARSWTAETEGSVSRINAFIKGDCCVWLTLPLIGNSTQPPADLLMELALAPGPGPYSPTDPFEPH